MNIKPKVSNLKAPSFVGTANEQLQLLAQSVECENVRRRQATVRLFVDVLHVLPVAQQLYCCVRH